MATHNACGMCCIGLARMQTMRMRLNQRWFDSRVVQATLALCVALPPELPLELPSELQLELTLALLLVLLLALVLLALLLALLSHGRLRFLSALRSRRP